MVAKHCIEPPTHARCLGLSQHRREIAYGNIGAAGRRYGTAGGTESMPGKRWCYRVSPGREVREAKLPVHIRQRRSGIGSTQIDCHVLHHSATHGT